MFKENSCGCISMGKFSIINRKNAKCILFYEFSSLLFFNYSLLRVCYFRQKNFKSRHFKNHFRPIINSRLRTNWIYQSCFMNIKLSRFKIQMTFSFGYQVHILLWKSLHPAWISAKRII